MDILLIRHGESLANTQGVYQGQTYDTELSEAGVKQAQALAKNLAKININAVYASPLKRTRQTAEIITENLLMGPAIIDQRIIEVNHGQWEGKSKSEIIEEFPGQLEVWKTEPETITMPDGENLSDVENRAFEFLKELATTEHSRVALVSHDSVIRVILTKLLRRELKDFWIYELDAAGYSTIEWNEKMPQVVKINENSHLEGVASDLAMHAL